MVKGTSRFGPNEVFRVRVLVGVLTAYGVCGVAVSARSAVNRMVWVRLPSDTPFEMEEIVVAKMLNRPALVLNRN
jgi:hypothetical protein